MPASTRNHASRPTSSRPYDRRSPTTSPTQSPCSPSPASPIQDPETPPDHPGLPTYAEYKRIQAGYLHSLSPRKRDKALITQAMFDKIWDVLHQPEACTIETPQFRFWVRKMFTLSRLPTPTGKRRQWGGGIPLRESDSDAGRRSGRDDDDGDDGGARGRAEDENDDDEDDEDDEVAAGLELERTMGIRRGTETDGALLRGAVVLHENRPVAIMEQLYELFCYCHVRAGHGGRDKTCAVIREHYSWVPKELTAQFVKACPTCASKRSGGGALGVVFQKRVPAGVGRERRRGRGSAVGEASATESPPALRWPTTGGPLDPANPLPCGVRERLLCVHGDAGPGLGSPAPNEVSPDGCLPSGWKDVSPPSPFRACDPAYAFGTGFFLPAFLIDDALAAAASAHRDGLELSCSPARTHARGFRGVPQAAVDAHRRRSTDAAADGEFGLCYYSPPSPLFHATAAVEWHACRPRSEDVADQLQIDPALLSLGCPGLDRRASTGPDGLRLVHMPGPADAPSVSDTEGYDDRAPADRDEEGGSTIVPVPTSTSMSARMLPGGRGVPALRTSTSVSTSTACSADSPDSSFEHASVTGSTAATAITTTAAGRTGAGTCLRPSSSSSSSPSPGRCGYGYSARDDPVLVGIGIDIGVREDQDAIDLDGTLSRFSILADG